MSGKKVIVMCGPSGAGKSSLLKKLMADFPDQFGFSVSHTTREPRQGERHGVDYHYTNKEDMECKIAGGEMLEYAHVHANIYGTSIQAVEDVVEKGRRCVLDIDVQGVDSVKKTSVDSMACYVFISPPSLEVLESRLRERGTETEEKIQTRLHNAKGEMAYKLKEGFWDAIIVNDTLEQAYEELKARIYV